LNHGKCTHIRTYELARLQAGVLDQLRQQIADPRAIDEAAREVHAEWSALQKEHRAKRAAAGKNLATVEAKILRLVNALEAGSMPESTLIPRLQEAERERVGLTEQARLIGAETNVIDVHPGLLDAYRANVEKLHAALIANPNTVENRTAFRMLVDSVIVHPTPKRAAYEFTTNGRLGAIMGVDLFPTARNAREILADHGVACSDTGNAAKPGLTVSQQKPTVISFGRWRERVAA
jgi:site-specific DNA recombinase